MAFTTRQAGAQTQQLAVPEQYTGDAQELARSQRLAQLLSGQQMPEGQMVSGRYVAPSWTQQLAGLVNAGTGAYFADKAETQQQALARKIREGEAATVADFMATKQGRPAVAEQVTEMAGPYTGNVPMPTATIEGRAATPANPQMAYSNLYADPRASTKLRDFAFNKMMSDPEEITMVEGSTRFVKNPDGSYKEVATGGEKLTNEYRDYLKAQKDPINPFKGGFTDYQTMSNRSKAPITNVAVNSANKFAGGFAEKASGGAYNMYEQALSAPQQIENAKRTIQLVNSGALTGPAANIGLEAAKIFNVAGANNQDTIAKTELLFSNRGKAMLGSIKQSGLAGSQGLTEGERKFLTQAEGGAITLNADTLKAMAGLEIKMAVANQKKWNAQAGKMDKDILNATGAGPVEVYTGIGTVDQKTVDKF